MSQFSSYKGHEDRDSLDMRDVQTDDSNTPNNIAEASAVDIELRFIEDLMDAMDSNRS